MPTIIEWNGREIPRALFGVEPGAYRLTRTLTDAQKDAASLDIEALGVAAWYRKVPIDILRLNLRDLDVKRIGDLETKATAIAWKYPGTWLQIPDLLRELPADYALRDCRTWRDIAHHALMRVEPKHAEAMRLRLGLDGPIMTRADVARRIGVSPPAIERWESRVRRNWRHGWSQRVDAKLKRLVRRRMRIATLMTKDRFFTINNGEERALALFIELVASFDYKVSRKHGGFFIERRKPFRPK
jgi:hypothetical protein